MEFEYHDGALRAKSVDWSFRISKHWTGVWLDGWLLSEQMIPVRLSTVQMAEDYARELARGEISATMINEVVQNAI